MPTGIAVTHETRHLVADLLEEGGRTHAEIAELAGVSQATVSRIRTGVMPVIRERVVAGDKTTGQLRTTGPHTWEGSRRLPNGKFEHREFTGSNPEVVKREFHMWKAEAVPQGDIAGEKEEKMGAAKGAAAKRAWYVASWEHGGVIGLFDSEERAVAVGQALEQAAKAGGVDNAVNVELVSEWTA